MRTPLIGEHMVRYPYVTNPEQSLAEASELMTELNIRHLPVVSEGLLKGIVSDRNLKAVAASENYASLTIGDVMKTDVYIVNAGTPLADVAMDMADGKFGSAIIVDSEREVIGIFTTTDALRILAQRIEDENVESFLLGTDDYEDGLMELNIG